MSRRSAQLKKLKRVLAKLQESANDRSLTEDEVRMVKSLRNDIRRINFGTDLPPRRKKRKRYPAEAHAHPGLRSIVSGGLPTHGKKR